MALLPLLPWLPLSIPECCCSLRMVMLRGCGAKKSGERVSGAGWKAGGRFGCVCERLARTVCGRPLRR